MAIAIPHFSESLYKWDLNVWRLLHQVASQKPDVASDAFGIDERAVDAITELSPRQCEQLASGVFCSFIPVFSNSDLELIIATASGDLSATTENSSNFIERIYWELVARSAYYSPELASARFGLSIETSRLMAGLSPFSVHDICAYLDTDFMLRGTASIIHEVQHASISTALMKRAAAALT